MKLRDYLTARFEGQTERASYLQFARKIKASASGVRKWAKGERLPRVSQMKRIAKATDGLVMPNDFMGSP